LGSTALVLIATAILTAQTPPGPPAWAYGVAPAGASAGGRGGGAAPDDGSPKHLPGSTQAFTLAQLRDSFNIADWYPGDHPPPPDVVMKGRAPNLRACGFCHYPNGRGRPENSGIAHLPVAYFTQQMADFKSGLRNSAEARKTNTV
jgi:cytochrome c553